jgi:hypothetical protein
MSVTVMPGLSSSGSISEKAEPNWESVWNGTRPTGPVSPDHQRRMAPAVTKRNTHRRSEPDEGQIGPKTGSAATTGGSGAADDRLAAKRNEMVRRSTPGAASSARCEQTGWGAFGPSAWPSRRNNGTNITVTGEARSADSTGPTRIAVRARRSSEKLGQNSRQSALQMDRSAGRKMPLIAEHRQAGDRPVLAERPIRRPVSASCRVQERPRPGVEQERGRWRGGKPRAHGPAASRHSLIPPGTSTRPSNRLPSTSKCPPTPNGTGCRKVRIRCPRCGEQTSRQAFVEPVVVAL